MAEVIRQISIDDLVFRAHKQFETVVSTQSKFFNARIECGRTLLELRQRIEAGEAGNIAWWAWYGEKFARSRRDAERVMDLASAENPVAAYEQEKAETRERVRAVREQKGPALAYSTPKNTPAESKVQPKLTVVQPDEERMLREYLIVAALAATEPLSIEESNTFLVRFRQQYRGKFYGPKA
jgi:hypothetical protein